MKTVFVDTDIMLDYFLERDVFYTTSLKLMNAGATGKVKLLTSVLTIAMLIYFLRKKFNSKEAQQKLKLLRTFVDIGENGNNEVDEMIISDFNDLEDALQHSIALRNKAEIIITRNKKDFKKSVLPVMNAGEFLKTLKTVKTKTN